MPAEVEDFVEDDFKDHPLVVKGYLGPGVLGATGPTGIRYLLDPRVVPGSAQLRRWCAPMARQDTGLHFRRFATFPRRGIPVPPPKRAPVDRWTWSSFRRA